MSNSKKKVAFGGCAYRSRLMRWLEQAHSTLAEQTPRFFAKHNLFKPVNRVSADRTDLHAEGQKAFQCRTYAELVKPFLNGTPFTGNQVAILLPVNGVRANLIMAGSGANP